MNSLNQANIIGNLTRDPEMKVIPSGQTVTTFSVATNRSWKDKSGEKKEEVEYHNIVVWGKLAEICGQYLNKGKKVFVSGNLKTRSWEATDGSKKSRTEIVAQDMIMLGGKSENHSERASTDYSDMGINASMVQPPEDEIKLEDIPF
jgi:single-strand DNA-binding protein